MTFDASFYRQVLPERVARECQGHPESVPVVNLHLANGRTLDLCHIIHLADTWFAVQYFRDTETCDDMDIAFLPYELVATVTVSLHHAGSRRIGFRLGERPVPADVGVSA
ncbi:MAG: hypothetical protein HYY00_05100 [Chloroflexi bacterium]|nr:hypothetical protein [Chloroflexota bacterium]